MSSGLGKELELPGGRVRTAILVLAIAVLAVEGYLAYRYYVALSNPPDASATQRNPETAAADTTVAGTTAETASAFVHDATRGTIVDNSTYLDDPSVNGNPDAVLLVTQLSGPGVAGDAGPIGVWYDANRGGSWAIFNQDLASMAEGATFNVTAVEEPGETVFVHRATPANTEGNTTYVEVPAADEEPDAVLAVTPNWNPGGGAGTYNDHPVGFRYDAEEEKWAILNLDRAPMPAGAAFNVAVLPGASTR